MPEVAIANPQRSRESANWYVLRRPEERVWLNSAGTDSNGDDENKKNGNVQHLRDHDIASEEAEGCFFHDYALAREDRRFEMCILLMEEPIAAEG